MRRLLQVLLGPWFWISVVQVAWTVTLVLWIVYFVGRHARLPHESWGVLVAGILLLVGLLGGVVAIVLHFARQVVLNRAVKDFVSRVSHDLRSPLASVKLHLETVQMRDLDDARRRTCLALALQELVRLESGIESVLAAARIERHGISLRAETVPLAGFLDAWADASRDGLRHQGATLEWEGAAAPKLDVRADPALLRRLLDNLVDNAVAHCQKGVRIALSLAEQGGCAVLSVRDDGPGLPRREWRRVFRMFHRASAARGRGTGLGLFIVEGIARAHGGRARVESAGPGKGCCFHVALPLAARRQGPAPPPQTAAGRAEHGRGTAARSEP